MFWIYKVYLHFPECAELYVEDLQKNSKVSYFFLFFYVFYIFCDIIFFIHFQIHNVAKMNNFRILHDLCVFVLFFLQKKPWKHFLKYSNLYTQIRFPVAFIVRGVELYDLIEKTSLYWKLKKTTQIIANINAFPIIEGQQKCVCKLDIVSSNSHVNTKFLPIMENDMKIPKKQKTPIACTVSHKNHCESFLKTVTQNIPQIFMTIAYFD